MLLLGPVPAIAGLILFVLLWSMEEISHPLLLAAWWIAATYLQFFVGWPVWLGLAGLLGHVCLAGYLSIRYRLASL